MFNFIKKANIDFVGRLKTYIIISLSIFIIGIIVQIVFGLKMDIEFKGGTLLSYSFTGDVDHEKADSAITEALGMDIKTDKSTDITGQHTYLSVTLTEDESLSVGQMDKITSTLKEAFPDNEIKMEQQNSVNPSVGWSFFGKSMFTIVLAMLGVIIYVGVRFRKIGGVSAGAMAMVALIHDMIFAYFVFVIFRIPLDQNFIAVLLTILGYSLNDTIVIYDRIREDKVKFGSKISVRELTNSSINRTLGRTLNTAFCTFFAIVTVCIVAFIMGLDSIISFALPMSVGVISGSYSTICLAGPLWVRWMEHKEIKAKSGKRPAAKKA